MSVRVIGDGANGYRLFSPDDEMVGWIRGRALGVSGFDDEAAAVSAAIRSYCSLRSWLERQGLHPLPALGDDPPRCARQGECRSILIGRVQVARLPAGTPYDPKAETHSFEIVLTHDISEGMGIHAGLVALRAAHPAVVAADIAWASRTRHTNNDNDDSRSTHNPTTHLQLEAR
jgi:hypothetical protein